MGKSVRKVHVQSSASFQILMNTVEMSDAAVAAASVDSAVSRALFMRLSAIFDGRADLDDGELDQLETFIPETMTYATPEQHARLLNALRVLAARPGTSFPNVSGAELDAVRSTLQFESWDHVVAEAKRDLRVQNKENTDTWSFPMTTNEMFYSTATKLMYLLSIDRPEYFRM